MTIELLSVFEFGTGNRKPDIATIQVLIPDMFGHRHQSALVLSQSACHVATRSAEFLGTVVLHGFSARLTSAEAAGLARASSAVACQEPPRAWLVQAPPLLAWRVQTLLPPARRVRELSPLPGTQPTRGHRCHHEEGLDSVLVAVVSI